MHLFSEERLFYREIKHGIFKSVCPDKVVIFHSNAYIILHHRGINLLIWMSGVGVGLKQNRFAKYMHLKFTGCKQYHERPIWPNNVCTNNLHICIICFVL